MKNKLTILAALAIAACTLTACGDSTGKAYMDSVKAEKYVKLGEYKGLEVSQTKTEVTEEYRDSYINYLLSMNPDRGVIEGDTVNIDYEGKMDGAAFPGGTAQGINLTIGSGQMIAGFEDGLIGVKVGETVDLNLTFPADYQSPEMAGKETVFTITVNMIMAAKPQELTDAYVTALGINCSTVEEYKEFVYNGLVEQEQTAYDKKIKEAIVTKAMENCEFTNEPPAEMLARHVDTLTKNLTAEAERFGSTLEQYMQLYYGMDAATYQAEIKSQALKSAQQYLMLQAIADIEKLNVTDEELQAEMETMAANAGYESVDEFKKVINDKGYKEYMMGQKVMNMMQESAVITEDAAAATVPAGTETAPVGTETAPAGTEAAPAETETAPAGTEAAPAGTEAAPAGTETAPTGTETAPTGTETAPKE